MRIRVVVHLNTDMVQTGYSHWGELGFDHDEWYEHPTEVTLMTEPLTGAMQSIMKYLNKHFIAYDYNISSTLTFTLMSWTRIPADEDDWRHIRSDLCVDVADQLSILFSKSFKCGPPVAAFLKLIKVDHDIQFNVIVKDHSASIA